MSSEQLSEQEPVDEHIEQKQIVQRKPDHDGFGCMILFIGLIFVVFLWIATVLAQELVSAFAPSLPLWVPYLIGTIASLAIMYGVIAIGGGGDAMDIVVRLVITGILLSILIPVLTKSREDSQRHQKQQTQDKSVSTNQ